jgi:hypothetical protein
MGSIKIKHSYNAGDLISIMPGLRQLYRDTGRKVQVYQRIGLEAFYFDNQINSTLDDKGTSVCMNERLYNLLKPLVEAQSYIEGMEKWEGQGVDLDYDATRDRKSIPLPYGLIHTWGEAVFPQTSTDLSIPWISVEPNRAYIDKIIISRTQRYTNPYMTYFFLKDHEDKLVFSGTEAEHELFCKANNLNIELIKAENFLELAAAMSVCAFVIRHKTLAWHIADGLKAPRILEVCQTFPNTFATGANGYHAFGQAAMEYYFKRLIDKT